MSDFISQLNENSMILISISVMLIAGFLMTRLTKLVKLPNVTGYLIAGILIGPYLFNIIPQEMVDGMSFISDIALSIIAFGVGSYFSKEAFKETGLKVILITLFESTLTGLLVTLVMHVILGDWNFSLLLGAIACATSPASTLATIRQYHANGNFVYSLLQVIALDMAVALIGFSFITALINLDVNSGFSFIEVFIPLFYNALALLFSFLSGWILSRLINTPKRTQDNRLILTLALLFGVAGFCTAVDISPLLASMAFGAIYINLTGDEEIYRQVTKFGSPILTLFFVLSGMNLNLSLFISLGFIGAIYFIVRIIGKYLGSYLGGVVTKTPTNVKKYLGLALIPQAGVAIGLAFLAKRILPEPMGSDLLTIILSASLLFELVGPGLAKLALFYSGSISPQSTGTNQ